MFYSMFTIRLTIIITQLYVEGYNRDYRVVLILDWAQSQFECCGTRVNGETHPWNIWHLHPDYECRKNNRREWRKNLICIMSYWVV